ncbi:hypothetical protein CU633_18790 [Bacillus sp. V3-13]|uniref:hypothetical protein n=1 Tax=Bacillus sp. V3-13 TaxID=2053728 RepID=UPI000C76A241|nr:hypothetical protein [Bacillus sp. V3-13]PLR75818.1 hypothetical protein CU633_18790 [Bacillus sp. V3-13]
MRKLSFKRLFIFAILMGLSIFGFKFHSNLTIDVLFISFLGLVVIYFSTVYMLALFLYLFTKKEE